jgi:adenosine deaminase
MDLFDLGVAVTLNTDDPSVSDLTLTDEYEVAVQHLGVTYEGLRYSVLNAAGAAFLPENGRKRLLTYFQEKLPED